ncbi:hypothetical protein HPB47_010948 [Ixodes persulcatus]|uniref:Uncharacterized protein n=1 Tax=Ixodes persulcatus TaxID=34615 RepID=A0AC60NXP6_IXOPE|nr:hypothetical protein HPB47_010948 [Ixodes persulcatus]
MTAMLRKYVDRCFFPPRPRPVSGVLRALTPAALAPSTCSSRRFFRAAPRICGEDDSSPAHGCPPALPVAVRVFGDRSLDGESPTSRRDDARPEPRPVDDPDGPGPRGRRAPGHLMRAPQHAVNAAAAALVAVAPFDPAAPSPCRRRAGRPCLPYGSLSLGVVPLLVRSET